MKIIRQATTYMLNEADLGGTIGKILKVSEDIKKFNSGDIEFMFDRDEDDIIEDVCNKFNIKYDIAKIRPIFNKNQNNEIEVAGYEMTVHTY